MNTNSQTNAPTFKDFSLRSEIQEALEECGYTNPTPIQLQTLNAFAEGKNIIAQSQTGTGKTAGFLLPILNNIDTQIRRPQGLVLAPTRELVMQIKHETVDLSTNMQMRSACLFGGQPKRIQYKILSNGPQLLVGTPGRTKDMLENKKIDTSHINYFVLDEVDRMLDMGFIDDVKDIFRHLPNIKHVMTFSATISPQIQKVIHEFVGDNVTVIRTHTEAVTDLIDHAFIDAPSHDKMQLAKELITNFPAYKIVIFAQTKANTEAVANILKQNNFNVCALHGDMEQRDRFRTLKDFKEGTKRVLVATDVAARGLNMNDIDLVINYDVPEDPESYIHRIGRTGRAGSTGRAIMFVDKSEIGGLSRIEKQHKITIKKTDLEGNEQPRPKFFINKGSAPKRRSRNNKNSNSNRNYGRKNYSRRSR